MEFFQQQKSELSSMAKHPCYIETDSYQTMVGDNSSSIMLDDAEYIVVKYVHPSISIFGIVCNILNLLVLTRRHMVESPFTYLTGLAISDLSVLTLSFLQTVFARPYSSTVYAWSVYTAYIFLPIANIMANSSVWITIALTIERYVSVSYPLRAKELCTRSMARKTMAVVYMACVVINIPRFLCREVVEVNGKFVVQQTAFEKSEVYGGLSWFYVLIIHIIPMVTLISLNTCLLRALRNAQRKRNNLVFHNHRDAMLSREQARLTVTCISIIILFIICILPSAFSQKPVSMALFGKGQTFEEFSQSSFYRLLRVVTNMLVYLNFSLNFVLYCMFNTRFTKTLRYLTWCCLNGFCCYYRIDYGEYTFRRLSTNSCNGSSGLLLQISSPPKGHHIRKIGSRIGAEESTRKLLCQSGCMSTVIDSSNKHYVINITECSAATKVSQSVQTEH